MNGFGAAVQIRDKAKNRRTGIVFDDISGGYIPKKEAGCDILISSIFLGGYGGRPAAEMGRFAPEPFWRGGVTFWGCKSPIRLLIERAVSEFLTRFKGIETSGGHFGVRLWYRLRILDPL